MQEVPNGISWEVIVIDNNSSDGTAGVAAALWKEYNTSIPFRVIEEPRPGLSFARMSGAVAAQFEFLLYCDDDNWLARDYVVRACEIMQSNPNIAVLGGRSTARFEGACPSWFPRFEKAYAVGRPMQQSGNANARTYLAGAGMVLRHSLLQKLESLNYKQMLTDRKGDELSSGGDAELCLLMMYLGYDLYYDGRLEFVHYMPAQRLQWSYCVKMMAEGHAIPQLYFDLYRYCYEHPRDHELMEFTVVYRQMLRKQQKIVLRSFLPIYQCWQPLLLLVKGQEGSKKEITLKAAINKLRWLYQNKTLLQRDFEYMQAFISKVLSKMEIFPVANLYQD